MVHTVKPLRAAIYARVSHDRTGRERSVTEQLAECRAEVARRGWVEGVEFVDNDRSASRYATKTRPEFASLLQRLPEFDVLVTWEASRLQRDLRTFADLRDACRLSGVLLCYSGTLIDLDHPDDSFRATLDAALAERESDITRSRIMRAVRANAAAGKPHGRILWGYKRVYDPQTKILVRQEIVPEVAELIRQMAAMTLAGRSARSIADWLNDQGVTLPHSPNQWRFTDVRRTLQNAGYAGYRTHRGEIVGPATWEPIIDEVTWHRLRAVMDPRRTGKRDGGARHLLSGLVECGVCHGPVTWRVSSDRTGVYACTACWKVSIVEPKLDGIVVDRLLRRLRRDAHTPLFAATMGEDPQASQALAEAQAERARLEEFYDQAATGALSAVALARIEARVLARVTELETRAHRTVPTAALGLLGEDAWDVWEALPIDSQRSTIRAFMRPVLHRASDPRRVTPGWLR